LRRLSCASDASRRRLTLAGRRYPGDHIRDLELLVVNLGNPVGCREIFASRTPSVLPLTVPMGRLEVPRSSGDLAPTVARNYALTRLELTAQAREVLAALLGRGEPAVLPNLVPARPRSCERPRSAFSGTGPEASGVKLPGVRASISAGLGRFTPNDGRSARPTSRPQCAS